MALGAVPKPMTARYAGSSPRTVTNTTNPKMSAPKITVDCDIYPTASPTDSNKRITRDQRIMRTRMRPINKAQFQTLPVESNGCDHHSLNDEYMIENPFHLRDAGSGNTGE